MVRRSVCASLSLALLAQPCLQTLAWAETAAAPVPVSSPASLGAGSSSPATGTTAVLNAIAAAQTPTAEALTVLPGRPPTIVHTENNPVEDFFAVTLISLPFTAFWALIGALAVGGVAQQRFPPEFDTPLLASAGAFAASAAVVTGLVSVRWGRSAPAPTPVPTPIPTPDPAPKDSAP